jgi:MATE family multidrug resistance protein
MASIALCYVLVPSVFIDPFAAKADPGAFEEVRTLATTILCFVAVYSVFDTMNIIFASALKGAGDTRFVMLASVGLAWALMVIPTWVACELGTGGIFAAWTFLSLYVIVVGFAFLGRFLHGKWRSMRVIEEPPHAAIPPTLPEAPTSEIDM